VLLPTTPGPSKRTSLLASVFDTYTLPVIGLAIMLKSTVPTWAYWFASAPICAGGFAVASILKTSRSGSVNGIALSQFRIVHVEDGQSAFTWHSKPWRVPAAQMPSTQWVPL